MQQPDELASLRAYTAHLNYAIATTTCRKTAGVLREMLKEAEARLSAHGAATPRSTSHRSIRGKDSLMRIALAGAGAFGVKHLDGLKLIDGVTVTSLVGHCLEPTQAIAEKYGIPHVATDLDESLARDDVDAVILCTPTQMHAAQAIQCMDAGKHVQVEIPLADSLADAEAVRAKQKETGLVCMVGHTRRFNPSHQWIHKRIKAGELTIQQMDAQTHFFRRKNINAKGEPRSWTDHLLWHHAAHTVDLFAYQTGSEIVQANAVQGPKHPELGIAMDMSIQLKAANGAICTLSLSFNNDGPLGSFFRYICDNGTWIARYDDLVTGKEELVDVSKVDVSMNGIELQDREFIAAIRDGREPNASVRQVLPCYRVLHDLERQLAGK
jgi:2-hydroxy-4-carboxymuconate semialdehyde hemiacetal dehydrogenase